MNTVIELSQRDSKNVTKNGDYDINLAYPVTINNGDIISVRNCYIDTVASSLDRIILEKDCILNISCGFYQLDWESKVSSTLVKYTYENIPNSNDVCPRGDLYILMVENSVLEISRLNFTPGDTGPYGGVHIKFNYVDENGDNQSITVHIPSSAGSFTNAPFHMDITMIRAREGTFGLDPSTNADLLKKKYNITYTGNNGVVDPGFGTRIDPYISNFQYTIPAGSYSPDEFGQIITDQFSMNNDNFQSKMYGTNYPLKNQFMYISDDFDTGGTGPVFWKNGDFTPTIANKVKILFVPDAKLVIGTSQVALEYLDDLDSFSFSAIHCPPYDDSGNISVGYYKNNLSPPNWFTYDKNSGIFFTQFDSQYTDGSPVDVFQDFLGFDRNQALVKISPNKTDGGTDYTEIETILQTGVNITGEYPSIDAFITKKGGTSTGTSSSTHYNIIDVANNVLATSTDTIKIVASTPFDDLDTTSAYYMVELKNTFKSGMLGSDDYNHNVMAVVSKFYSYKTFTTGNLDSSLRYIHEGPTMLLSNIRVQIKDPNTKQVATDLGKDNTILLEIDRAQTDQELNQQYMKKPLKK